MTRRRWAAALLPGLVLSLLVTLAGAAPDDRADRQHRAARAAVLAATPAPTGAVTGRDDRPLLRVPAERHRGAAIGSASAAAIGSGVLGLGRSSGAAVSAAGHRLAAAVEGSRWERAPPTCGKPSSVPA